MESEFYLFQNFRSGQFLRYFPPVLIVVLPVRLAISSENASNLSRRASSVLDYYFMNNFLTQESPGKVMGLLGVALSSMFFLFMVTVGQVSLQQSHSPLPDPFNPGKVMAMLDGVSNRYAYFLGADLLTPAQNDFGKPIQTAYNYYSDGFSYIMDEASPGILKYTGLAYLAQTPSQLPATPAVAGDSTTIVQSTDYPQSAGGFSIDTLYPALIR